MRRGFLAVVSAFVVLLALRNAGDVLAESFARLDVDWWQPADPFRDAVRTGAAAPLQANVSLHDVIFGRFDGGRDPVLAPINVPMWAVQRLSLRLENDTGARVTISNVSVSDQAFRVVYPTSDAVVVEPGRSTVVGLWFSPGREGLVDSHVALVIEGAPHALPIRGQGIANVFDLAPLDGGKTLPGHPVLSAVRVANPTTRSLQIFEARTDADFLAISVPIPAEEGGSEWLVRPGETSVVLELSFASPIPGLLYDSLVLETSEGFFRLPATLEVVTFGLHAVPSTVDVGVVTSPRSWGQHPVRLFNADPRPATITAVLATPVRSADGAAGPPLAVAQHVAGSVTVPPGGYQTVLVLGAPPDASLPPGDFSATILIGTDDPDQPPVRVTWRALVAYGSLLVPDEAVTFHVARVAAEGGVRRSIRLTNNFPGPLTLLGATSSSDAIAVEGVGSSQVATPWGEALPVITVLVRPSAALTLPAPLGTHQLLVATDVTSVRIPIRLAFDPLSLVCVGSPSDLEEVSPNEWRTHGGAHVGLVAPGAPIDHWCLLTNASEEPLVLPSLRVELSTPEAHVSVHVHTPDGGQHSAVFGSEVVRDLRVRASLDPFASALVHIELHPGLAQGRQTGTVRAVARQGGGEGAPEDWAFPLTWVVSQGQLEISRGSGAVHVVPGVPASVALTASSDLSVAVALRGAQANSLTVVLDVADGNAAVLPGARGQPLGVIWIDAARGVSPASYAAWAFDEWDHGSLDQIPTAQEVAAAAQRRALHAELVSRGHQHRSARVALLFEHNLRAVVEVAVHLAPPATAIDHALAWGAVPVGTAAERWVLVSNPTDEPLRVYLTHPEPRGPPAVAAPPAAGPPQAPAGLLAHSRAVAAAAGESPFFLAPDAVRHVELLPGGAGRLGPILYRPSGLVEEEAVAWVRSAVSIAEPLSLSGVGIPGPDLFLARVRNCRKELGPGFELAAPAQGAAELGPTPRLRLPLCARQSPERAAPEVADGVEVSLPDALALPLAAAASVRRCAAVTAAGHCVPAGDAVAEHVTQWLWAIVVANPTPHPVTLSRLFLLDHQGHPACAIRGLALDPGVCALRQSATLAPGAALEAFVSYHAADEGAGGGDGEDGTQGEPGPALEVPLVVDAGRYHQAQLWLRVDPRPLQPPALPAGPAEPPALDAGRAPAPGAGGRGWLRALLAAVALPVATVSALCTLGTIPEQAAGTCRGLHAAVAWLAGAAGLLAAVGLAQQGVAAREGDRAKAGGGERVIVVSGDGAHGGGADKTPKAAVGGERRGGDPRDGARAQETVMAVEGEEGSALDAEGDLFHTSPGSTPTGAGAEAGAGTGSGRRRRRRRNKSRKSSTGHEGGFELSLTEQRLERASSVSLFGASVTEGAGEGPGLGPDAWHRTAPAPAGEVPEGRGERGRGASASPAPQESGTGPARAPSAWSVKAGRGGSRHPSSGGSDDMRSTADIAGAGASQRESEADAPGAAEAGPHPSHSPTVSPLPAHVPPPPPRPPGRTRDNIRASLRGVESLRSLHIPPQPPPPPRTPSVVDSAGGDTPALPPGLSPARPAHPTYSFIQPFAPGSLSRASPHAHPTDGTPGVFPPQPPPPPPPPRRRGPTGAGSSFLEPLPSLSPTLPGAGQSASVHLMPPPPPPRPDRSADRGEADLRGEPGGRRTPDKKPVQVVEVVVPSRASERSASDTGRGAARVRSQGSHHEGFPREESAFEAWRGSRLAESSPTIPLHLVREAMAAVSEPLLTTPERPPPPPPRRSPGAAHPASGGSTPASVAQSLSWSRDASRHGTPARAAGAPLNALQRLRSHNADAGSSNDEGLHAALGDSRPSSLDLTASPWMRSEREGDHEGSQGGGLANPAPARQSRGPRSLVGAFSAEEPAWVVPARGRGPAAEGGPNGGAWAGGRDLAPLPGVPPVPPPPPPPPRVPPLPLPAMLSRPSAASTLGAPPGFPHPRAALPVPALAVPLFVEYGRRSRRASATGGPPPALGPDALQGRSVSPSALPPSGPVGHAAPGAWLKAPTPRTHAEALPAVRGRVASRENSDGFAALEEYPFDAMFASTPPVMGEGQGPGSQSPQTAWAGMAVGRLLGVEAGGALGAADDEALTAQAAALAGQLGVDLEALRGVVEERAEALRGTGVEDEGELQRQLEAIIEGHLAGMLEGRVGGEEGAAGTGTRQP